jgi:hypothetical protein
MAAGDQWTVWDPFLTADHLTAKQRDDMERGRAWAYFINGGGGDPRYFDYLTWLKNAERQHER